MTRDVRQATTDDVWAIHETARESWHAAYDDLLGPGRVDGIVDDWYALGDLESAIADASGRDDALFLVVTAVERRADGPEETKATGVDDADDCLGFAHLVPWPEDRTVGYLARIYVTPDHWGEGIGTTLLEHLEDEIDAFERFRLAVLAGNDVGVSFYESAGFQRVTTRETDLGDGLEEYVYEKRL
ncbi:GNAT family N-acetyltransferase [Natronobacterium gregoryi]|uniref:Acetyltransferase n=2 Tax=Natronobacterium gregoryi TaxID=44930 RepID=L0AL13_NATGS|nr:GNAT family N-acetyltransferase [Natronobacterium gregoryi]AFZ73877.1 acetyltransferase [Natronobacterium gregoryi SP2]ELY65037.1 N-acetyltransferase GCN5 [Natronobacterium gregoryi SP2]PLK18414.1 N-acetyltransferase [Natronobacterium gregoryi SP2]SFJ71142.1 Acetyltransferase (GNAT) family protein [Natronobacterium gregoryi]